MAITSGPRSSADCQSWPAEHADRRTASLAPATTNGAALLGQFHDTSGPWEAPGPGAGVADWRAAGAGAAGAGRADPRAAAAAAVTDSRTNPERETTRPSSRRSVMIACSITSMSSSPTRVGAVGSPARCVLVQPLARHARRVRARWSVDAHLHRATAGLAGRGLLARRAHRNRPDVGGARSRSQSLTPMRVHSRWVAAATRSLSPYAPSPLSLTLPRRRASRRQAAPSRWPRGSRRPVIPACCQVTGGDGSAPQGGIAPGSPRP